MFDWLRDLFTEEPKSKSYNKPKTRAPTPEPEDTFWIPWGSESICSWCKEHYKCSWFKEDKFVQIVMNGILVNVKPSELMKGVQLRSCPIESFDLDRDSIPERFKGYKVKLH